MSQMKKSKQENEVARRQFRVKSCEFIETPLGGEGERIKFF